MNRQQEREAPVFILDRPAHGGNVGSVMRAMGNMGFTRLRLVSPREFPHPEAVNFAAGCAPLLEGVEVFSSLDAALADITWLVATTNRFRGQRHTVYSPRQLGAVLPGVLEVAGQRVGILFGTERTGLETADLARAHVLCNIPTAGLDGSLNLAQAVLVIAYELMLGLEAGRSFQAVPVVGETAPVALMDRFFAHLEEVLFRIGFLKPHQDRHMMGSLRALFMRAAPDRREVAILRGILNEVLAYPQRERQEP